MNRSFWLILFLFQITAKQITSTNKLAFIEQPSDTYLTASQPAILKCKIQNARSAFFNCNVPSPQDALTTNMIQIGNKQLLLIEYTITQAQLSQTDTLSCTCQGWLTSADDDSITSRRALVKRAFLDDYFEWEPMTTSGLIGKSAEIRCLPPTGDPKPIVKWLKNGVPIDKSNTRVITSNEGSLLINQVETSDAANYTCVAENLVGTRTSDPALLVVTENKGWTEWSEWSRCNVSCGEGFKKRVRSCLNPPTINNALGCQGFPEQLIACYEPCQGKVRKEEKSLVKMLKKEVEILAEDSEVNGWSEWSPWSMICNSDCTRSRKRDCNSGDVNACRGSDVEIDKCPYFCEPKIVPTKSSHKPSEYNPITHIIPPAIFLAVFLLSVILLSIALKRQFCAAKSHHHQPIKDFNHHPLPTPPPADHPIYYSVHPDYSHDHYMDLCTLLPQPQHHLDTCLLSKPSQHHLTAHNYLLYDRTGSNSTTSSNLKLTSSPTDSLEKNTILSLDDQTEQSPACQITRLINEHKLSVRPTKTPPAATLNSAYDLYAFNVFKSGGLIEMSKYSLTALVPDDTFCGDINLGVFKSTDQSLLGLEPNETLLSPIVVVKTDSFKAFAKPLIFGIDHAAQKVHSHWQTAVYYKSLNSACFERVDEKCSDTVYSHVEASRCYVMTERDGVYVLAGRPRAPGSECVKEMRYAIGIRDGVLKVLISANNQAAVEAVSEVLQGGVVIKMPEVFEMPLEEGGVDCCLSLEAKLVYSDFVGSNSDLTCCSLQLADVWGSCREFVEIDVMAVNRGQTRVNLSVGMRLGQRLVFSYSSLNAVEVSAGGEQEFYSCVSVSPVFVPLKITNLLDEYVSRCFRINTLRKTDWSLFANLIKCDRDAKFFANNRNNSFELCLSLLLMINLSKSQSIKDANNSISAE